MSIVIHCQNCKKKIKAPDSFGGKYGKCPFCQHKNYIPLPQEPDFDEIKLAPIDDQDQKQKQQMLLETYSLTQQILQENQIPDEVNLDNGGEREHQEEIPSNQLLNLIIKYLSNMAHSNLDAAQNILKDIIPHKEKANDLLDRLLRAGAGEKELQDISPTILKGLIANLKKLL